MDQHVRCLYADAHDTGEEMNHDMRLVLRSLLRPLRTGLLDLLDLVHDEPQAGHVATKFEQRVGRERHPLGGPQRCETVRRLAQRGLEASNPEAGQTPLHSVHKARALTNERLALTVGALGILLRQRWNGRHVAVIGFAAQPADEDPFEQSRVEAIFFRRPMLARDGHAGRVDDVGFDTAGPEPQRPSQNPSRPASNATTMRVIVRPFWVASARQRINNRSKSTSLGSSFFSGWRSIPGTMPATSQLAWLISITAMIVLSCSRGVRDRLRSSSCCAMGRSIALLPATMVTSSPPSAP